jgi:methionyl-tRNA synthetase
LFYLSALILAGPRPTPYTQKVEEAALKNGMEPQEWADKNSVMFRELLDTLHITNDQFIRTTETAHKESVQHLWKTLLAKEYIYLGFYEGWYSVRDECFYTESELVDGKAPTGAEVEWLVKEPSYFFKLSAFEDKLLEYFDANPDFIAPASRKNEVRSVA